MLHGLKPYSEFQPAHPWLGAVPASWTLTTLGAITARRSARNRTDLPLLSVLREKGVVPRSSLGDDENYNFIPDDLSNYRVAFAGDLVVNKMKAWQGSVGIAPCDGIVSPAYFVFALFGITQPFAHRLLRSTPYVAFFGQSSDGVRIGQWDLSIDRMKRIPVPVPPPDEQAGIVRFLGAVDRKVNRFIRAKRRLIEVLTEQKQAIITHAVTKGLNPRAPLKPSGIEWLGDVPEHWEVRRAGSVADFISTKAHEQFVEEDGEHICVTARFVSTDGRSFRRCTKNLSPAQRGDVLMVMSDLPRGRALARAYIVDDDKSYAVNQRVCILRPRRVNPRFLAFAANRHAELLAHDDGFNQTHLPNAAFKIMRLSLPPLPEQASIVEALLRATGAIDATLERTSREIDLIREYRTRLVADVVTGKLDVRGMTVGDEADGQSTDAHELAAESPMGDDPLEADEDSAPHAEEVEA